MSDNKLFLRVSINFFSVFTIISIYVPYMQVYLRRSGSQIDEVGYILAIAQGFAVIGPIVFGAISKKGVQPKYIVSIVTLVIILLFFNLQFVSSFLLKALLFGALGFSFSALIPVADALANGTLPEPDIQYGRARVFGTFGFVVPTILYGVFGFPDRFPAVSILYIGMIAAVFHLITAQWYPAYQSTNDGGIQKKGSLGFVFWVLIIISFLNRFAMAAHYSFFSLYLSDMLGIDRVGWFWLIGPAIETPVIFLGGVLLSRLSIPVMLSVSGLAIAIRLGVYAFFPTFVPVLAVQFLHGGTFGFFYIAMIAAIRRSVSRHNLTFAMAVFAGVGMGLGPIVGSSIGGYLIESFSYRVLYSVASIMGLLSIAVAYIFRKRLHLLKS